MAARRKTRAVRLRRGILFRVGACKLEVLEFDRDAIRPATCGEGDMALDGSLRTTSETPENATRRLEIHGAESRAICTNHADFPRVTTQGQNLVEVRHELEVAGGVGVTRLERRSVTLEAIVSVAGAMTVGLCCCMAS